MLWAIVALLVLVLYQREGFEDSKALSKDSFDTLLEYIRSAQKNSRMTSYQKTALQNAAYYAEAIRTL